MKHSVFSGVSCVFAGTYHGMVYYPVNPPIHTFCFPVEGEIRAHISSQTLICAAGDYLYLPAGEAAHISACCNFCILVRIPAHCIPYSMCFGTAAVYKETAASSVFHALAEAYTGSGQASVFAMDTQFLHLLAMHDALACAAGSDAKAHIAPGVALLELEFLQNEPVSRYAEACLMKETRFRMLFSQCYGISPVEYRTKLRLERAQMLLQTACLPVKDVAQATGFHSVSYFCRQYKSAYGHTPGSGEAIEHA